jgi:glycosyltransferase involved in cell wall biosynthesis
MPETGDVIRKRVSVVIPAYNEAQTIAGVVGVLDGHPLVDEIIVVSDGSKDETAARARAAGARVIDSPVNRGKAAAMELGVEAARHEHVLLLDADISGLTHEIITRLVTPVLRGHYAMYVGLCDRRVYWLNRLLRFFPIIGGERAITRSLWRRVPAPYKRKFQIEIALNFFAKKFGERMGFAVMSGLGQVIKERKRGLWLGLGQRLSMCADIVIAAVRLYLVYNVAAVFQRLPPVQQPEEAVLEWVAANESVADERRPHATVLREPPEQRL